MNWKNMPLAHKTATGIAGIAVLLWLIHQVQPGLIPIDRPILPLRCLRCAKQ